MYWETQQERMDMLCDVFVEMSRGNFAYTLKRSGKHEEFDAICLLINMANEDIRESFKHHSLVNPRQAYRYLLNMGIILDTDHCILNVNTAATGILGRSFKELQGKPLKAILAPSSRKKWEEFKKVFSENPDCNHFEKLTYEVSPALTVPAFCNVLRFPGSPLIYIFSIVISRQEEPAAHKAGKGSPQRYPSFQEHEARLIQDVHDYILRSPEHPLPSLKALARHFSTNEHKLKSGFKKYFGDTIFHYFNHKRLERALFLIQHSHIPLKAIAGMTGFKTYPHFYKAFKLKYGDSPGTLRKKA
ncbi:helix-turn-helix domain-containing protein [Sinomicrobium sp. M5D2P9]